MNEFINLFYYLAGVLSFLDKFFNLELESGNINSNFYYVLNQLLKHIFKEVTFLMLISLQCIERNFILYKIDAV